MHLHTQFNSGAPLGGDRHGFHEPEPGRTRRPGVRVYRSRLRLKRKVVVGHWQDEAGGPGWGGRPRAASTPGLRAGALRRQHARRGRDRRRQGRSAAAARLRGVWLWRGRPGAVRRRGRDSEVDALEADYDDLRVVPELQKDGERTRRCARPRGSSGAAAFLTKGGFRAFTTNFEDLGGLRSCRGWRCSG